MIFNDIIYRMGYNMPNLNKYLNDDFINTYIKLIQIEKVFCRNI